MSYILEALKKSERERKSKGELPDLQSLYVPSAQKKTVQPLWFLVIFICLCNVAFFGFWLYKNYWADAPIDPVSIDPASIDPASIDDVITADRVDQYRVTDELLPSSPPAPTPPSPILQPPEVPLIKVPDHLEAATSATQKVPSATQPFTELKKIPNYVPTDDDVLRNSDVPTDIELAEGETLIQPRARQPRQARSAAEPRTAQPARSADSWESIPRLKELPTDFQRQIPDLIFLSHMYSSDPTSRSVVINGDLLREKDLIAGDLVLEGIYDQGVIISFSGQRFRVSVLEDWSFR